MIISNRTSQFGVGLIEVMIALLLLGVAILGFSALQTRAVQTTDESLMRTRALTILRGAAESMRANGESIDSFKKAINSKQENVTIDGKDITIQSCIYTSSGKSKSICNFNQIAARDALVVKKFAQDNELKIKLQTCPTQKNFSDVDEQKNCFLASWNGTEPKFSSDKKSCAKEDGSYNSGSHCFILEAY